MKKFYKEFRVVRTKPEANEIVSRILIDDGSIPKDSIADLTYLIVNSLFDKENTWKI